MAATGLAFIVTVLLMLVIRPIAVSIGLLDRPGGRKTHHGAVPVFGGIAIFIGAAFGMTALPASAEPFVPFLMASALLVATGAIDDRFGLSPYIRLLAQTCAALAMMIMAGMKITSLGSILGPFQFHLAGFSVIFTIVGTVGAINAFNMMDGMDGLAGGLASVGLGTLAIAVVATGHTANAMPVAVVVAAVSGFLLFNLPVRLNRQLRTFMGDAGSTFLGFAVAWFGIHFSQGDAPLLSPVMVMWASSVPLMELLSSSIRRLAVGRSPLRADADHFHHVLIRAGYSVQATFIILIGLEVLLSLIGLTLTISGVPDYVSFLVLVLLMTSASILLRRADRYAPRLPRAMRRDRRAVLRELYPSVEAGLSESAGSRPTMASSPSYAARRSGSSL